MNKKITIVFLALLLATGTCFASEITRSLSSATVSPGEDLAVTLTITITEEETFYAIDELVPEGWTIKDAGTGSAKHEGHLKWVVIQNAANTTYTYVLTAPAEEETATLAGRYQFEGMTTEANIGGTTSVTVTEKKQPPITPPVTPPADYTLPAIALIIAAIVIAIFIFYNRK